MWDKIRMKRWDCLKKICGGVLLATALVVGQAGGMHVCANSDVKDEVSDKSAEQASVFEIDAEVLGADKNTYNIQVNVKNAGSDWDGIVRVYTQADYSIGSYYSGNLPNAYDTALSLPQGSEKQFIVKMPKGSNRSGGSNVHVVLVDKKGKAVADKLFYGLLLNDMETISLGILSDKYAELTYLDMGGLTMYYYGMDMPVKLVDVSKSKLTDCLDMLTILVIDEYNTDVLTDEEKDALSLWIDNGGVLIVGTGAAAKETLGGLKDVIPDMECLSVSKPGEGTNVSNNEDQSLDVTKLSMANLQGKSMLYNESYFSKGLMASVGDGAVGIAPFSLVELGQKADSALNDFPQEQYVLNLLEEYCGPSSLRWSRAGDAMNVQERFEHARSMIGMVGNANTSLNFGILKVLVVLYVILVGPVLYLILRAAKKREWYWIGVPVTAVVGIFVVSAAGRGFEVVDTSIHSVTVEDLSGKQNVKSYLYGYNADREEWSLQMADDYDYAGCLESYSRYVEKMELTEYYYRIQNEGGKLAIGMNPESSFEDSYFYAGKGKGVNSGLGKLEISDINMSWSALEGVVTNNTGKNFEYFAVIANDTVYIYKNLPAGKAFSLGNNKPVYASGSGFHIRRDYVYDFLQEIHEGDIKEDLALTSALGVGLTEAYPENDSSKVVICGVTKDWDKTIDDTCNETSYGCVYAIY